MNHIDIEKYSKWLDEGISFPTIQDDLKKNGFSASEARKILREIDAVNMRDKLKRIQYRQGIQLLISGGILSTVSLFVFLNGFLPAVIYAYGALASGIAMIALGKSKLKDNGHKSPFLDRPKRFRNRYK
jgi:hypothetical protein